MIRAYQPDDLDAVMQLWLSGTIAAHPFITEQYWHESGPLVRNTYLPAARTWLYLPQETQSEPADGENTIVGFISILEEQLVGALFVDQSYYGKGVGKILMNYVQQHYSALTLEVYQHNYRAYHFYRKQGFIVTERAYNEETKSVILTMQWQQYK
ncbi:TPA: N-acetyltransferase [Yersinia enterocolitica]|uniref:Acetyltransferase n=1 Tax=Yersinia enterocolitica TaxID=630 RepID=A0ABM9S1N4_YEREN|nr:N-acetyltransferase [Yersinia enterocolitica]CND91171.1 acetyltransferase [Yersinia enterocolitica]CNF79864.1 acetyltransferase [Yersinia enterocolitica]CQD68094.1 acetyltransferase [Yersinia enterocolitica]CRX83281.1 acetyltransferase [Yersinia enterocolitica]HDL6964874.1 N-acetyltransferase [Yersinia enterocolitica]